MITVYKDKIDYSLRMDCGEKITEVYNHACSMDITEAASKQAYITEFQKKTDLIDSYDWERDFQNIIDVANALNNPVRLKILLFIHLSKSTCFCELEAAFNFKQSTLTYHLKLLQRANLVHTKKTGRWKIFSANLASIKTIPQSMFDLASLVEL